MGGGVGGGSGGGGTMFRDDEVGLTPEGLSDKRKFAEWAANSGEKPACVTAEFKYDVTGESPDYLMANSVEVGTHVTYKGNSLAIRRCGRVGCSVECVLVIDAKNQITDAGIGDQAGCRAQWDTAYPQNPASEL